MDELNTIYQSLNDTYNNIIKSESEIWSCLTYQLTIIGGFITVILLVRESVFAKSGGLYESIQGLFINFSFFTSLSGIFLVLQIIKFLRMPVLVIYPNFHNITAKNLSNIKLSKRYILEGIRYISVVNVENIEINRSKHKSSGNAWTMIVCTSVAFLSFLILYCIGGLL